MARPLRLEFAGALYHLTSRGDHRENIFLDDTDRRIFLQLLGKEILQQHWLCYAYCLMDNHYHVLIETPEPNLVRGMRRLNGVYTQSFNRRHGRVGHVFQGRYKAILVDKENYLLELCRYIVAEPRAGQDSCDGGKVAVVKLSSHRGRDCASQLVGGRQSGELFFRPPIELSEVCRRGDYPSGDMGAFERTNLFGGGGISRAHAKYCRSKSRTRDRQSPKKTIDSECGRDR